MLPSGCDKHIRRSMLSWPPRISTPIAWTLGHYSGKFKRSALEHEHWEPLDPEVQTGWPMTASHLDSGDTKLFLQWRICRKSCASNSLELQCSGGLCAFVGASSATCSLWGVTLELGRGCNRRSEGICMARFVFCFAFTTALRGRLRSAAGGCFWEQLTSTFSTCVRWWFPPEIGWPMMPWQPELAIQIEFLGKHIFDILWFWVTPWIISACLRLSFDFKQLTDLHLFLWMPTSNSPSKDRRSPTFREWPRDEFQAAKAGNNNNLISLFTWSAPLASQKLPEKWQFSESRIIWMKWIQWEKLRNAC